MNSPFVSNFSCLLLAAALHAQATKSKKDFSSFLELSVRFVVLLNWIPLIYVSLTSTVDPTFGGPKNSFFGYKIEARADEDEKMSKLDTRRHRNDALSFIAQRDLFLLLAPAIQSSITQKSSTQSGFHFSKALVRPALWRRQKKSPIVTSKSSPKWFSTRLDSSVMWQSRISFWNLFSQNHCSSKTFSCATHNCACLIADRCHLDMAVWHYHPFFYCLHLSHQIRRVSSHKKMFSAVSCDGFRCQMSRLSSSHAPAEELQERWENIPDELMLGFHWFKSLLAA